MNQERDFDSADDHLHEHGHEHVHGHPHGHGFGGRRGRGPRGRWGGERGGWGGGRRMRRGDIRRAMLVALAKVRHTATR